jgi:6-phosphogluconolactonase (cycloisomerase 2 family)
MGMKWLILGSVLALVLGGFVACSSVSSTVTSSGTGVLYLVTPLDTTLSTYTISLGSGDLALEGSTLSTSTSPVAMALTPSLNALFVANGGSNNVSAYSLSSDGSLLAAGGTTNAGTTPMGLAIDPAGKFLFVANEASSNISVFTISGTSLTQVSGSPFTTIPAGTTGSTDPVGLVVSATGNFLYVANQSANTVAAFSIATSGALTPLGQSPYGVGDGVGTSPSGVAITPSGAFLYIANSGSNNVSAFAICDKVVTSCATPNSPDGTLTAVTGSPFSAGIAPIAVAADPFFNFVYVLDKGSNQISAYSLASGSGVLSPLSPGATSTGTTPTSFVVVSGTTGTALGNTTTNPTDYIYVANNAASTLSVFSLNTTTGLLTPVGAAVTVSGNPSIVAAN